MLRRPRRRTRRRPTLGRSPLSGSFRLFLLLLILVGVNVYVFFFRGGTAVHDVLKAAAVPPQPPAARGKIGGALGPGEDQGDALTPVTVGREDAQLVVAILQPGDTLMAKLLSLQVSRSETSAVVEALRKVLDLQSLRPGQTLRLRRADGQLQRLELATSPIVTYRVTREPDDTFHAVRREQPLETRVTAIGGTLESSLYLTVRDLGESTSLVAEIASLFAHDINFYVDPRKGDTFRVLVEKLYNDGEFYRYGRILAAEYSGQVGTFRAFHFEANPDGKAGLSGYYNEHGQNCAKILLKTPLKYARISSRFDRKRLHPILHVHRGHMGVDYAAPTGTPIWASAEGTVVAADRRRGSGNTVILRHAGGLVTLYFHLSRFARSLKRGQTVRQKQVIGYVGSTGLSTGPHLHFGVKQNGAYIDPLKMKIPRLPPLPTRYRAAFKRLVEPRLARLTAIKVTPAGRAGGASGSGRAAQQ